MTQNNRTLEECSSCRFWTPTKECQLCYEGNCSVDYPLIIPKNRDEWCDKHTKIEGELEVGEND